MLPPAAPPALSSVSTAPEKITADFPAVMEGVPPSAGFVTPSEGPAPPLSPAPSISNRTSPSLPGSKSSWASVLTENESNDLQIPVPDRTSKGVVRSSLPVELLKDQVPLWTKYIAGHFIGDVSPHIGKVHATVNRLWTSQDKKSRIDAQFISPKVVLFRIEDETMRRRVLQRHFWHVSDIPMIVREWTPSTAGKSPDLSSIPLWVDFIKVPDTLFSRKGLLFLGNLVGKAQKLHPTTERCTRFDVARVLVEVNLNFDLPSMIKLNGESEISIPIAYPWLPPRCSKCGGWGHKDIDCSPLAEATLAGSTSEKSSSPDRRLSADPTLASDTRGVAVIPDVPDEPEKSEQDNSLLGVGTNAIKNVNQEMQLSTTEDQQIQDEAQKGSFSQPSEQAEKSWTIVSKAKGSPGRTIMTRGKCVATGELLPSRYQILEKEPHNLDDIEDGEIQGEQKDDSSLDEEDLEAYAPHSSSQGEENRANNVPKKQTTRRKDNKVIRQTNKSKKSSSRKA